MLKVAGGLELGRYDEALAAFEAAYVSRANGDAHDETVFAPSRVAFIA
jgi:hypothetical protein